MDNVSIMLSGQTAKLNGEIIFDQLPKIYTSSSLLTVIFKNLIENGLKYNKSEKPQVTIQYQQNSNEHIYLFTDNGIGIENKYFDYIFHMFKRLESRSKQGSGLGLGLVKKSVEKLGGNISVASELGVGSTFTLKLPKNYIVDAQKN